MALDSKTKQIFEQIDGSGGMSVNPVKTPHDTIQSTLPHLTAHVTDFTAFYTTNKAALDPTGLTDVFVATLTPAITSANTKNDAAYAHSLQVVKEFSPRIQAAEQYISNMKILEKPVTGNPHTEAIQTITPTGFVVQLATLTAKINALDTAYNTMKTNGAAGISTNAPLVKAAITDFINTVTGLNFDSMVTTENQKLDLFSSLSGKVFLAKILPTWYADSSTKTAVDIVATQSVKDLIK